MPCYSFISWLAILNTLSTKERQLKRGRSIDASCVFWQHVLSISGVTRVVSDWIGELVWAKQHLQKNKKINSHPYCLDWHGMPVQIAYGRKEMPRYTPINPPQ